MIWCTLKTHFNTLLYKQFYRKIGFVQKIGRFQKVVRRTKVTEMKRNDLSHLLFHGRFFFFFASQAAEIFSGRVVDCPYRDGEDAGNTWVMWPLLESVYVGPWMNWTGLLYVIGNFPNVTKLNHLQHFGRLPMCIVGKCPIQVSMLEKTLLTKGPSATSVKRTDRL